MWECEWVAPGNLCREIELCRFEILVLIVILILILILIVIESVWKSV